MGDAVGEVLSPDLAAKIVNPASYGSRGDIFDVHSWLRANAPLRKAAPDGYDPFWVVTRHADIRQIAADADTFRSELEAIFLTDRAGQQQIRELTGGYAANLMRSVLTMDAPEHGAMRGIAQAWFAPRNLTRLEARIRELARELIDEMAASGGTCDFAADVALHFPIRVILEIMGLPQSDEPLLLKLTQELLGASDPEFARDGQAEDPTAIAAGMSDVVADFRRYFADLVERRRASPGQDVATVIATAEIDGAPISVDDAVNYYITLATAGHDTTSSSLAGAVAGLCDFPDEWTKVRADRGLIPRLVDEAFRWTTPIRHFMRTAVRDATVGGETIRAGDRVMLNYLSGNRDETVFTDPHGFHADRSPNPHLAFGYGPHVCLGQHLAKLELRIFFEELAERVSTIERAGPGREVDTTLIGGLKSLPVRIRLSA